MLDRFNYCGDATIYKTSRDQDKISFAVEQLEKVKEFINNNSEKNYGLNASVFYVVDINELCKLIDNQIKQLKEGK